MRRRYLVPLLTISIAAISGCSNRASQASAEQRPFFQEEYGLGTHGKKTLFDRVVEFDPGQLRVDMADNYNVEAPAIVAVLPFDDQGSAQFTVDKVPLTFRGEDARLRWAWTDAQRLRRAMVGYLAEREFVVINPIAVDAVLKQQGIDNAEKLMQVSPLQFRKWFGCDAVVVGTVEHYEAYYFGLIAAYNVGLNVRMISARTGDTLMRAHGSRWDTNFTPAMDPLDIAINSAENLLELRDVNLARAEEETAREIVLRIPPSDKLKQNLEDAALTRANQIDAPVEASTDSTHSNVTYVTHANTIEPEYRSYYPAPQHVDDAAATPVSNANPQADVIDGQSPDLKTASSWHDPGAHSASF
jgi:hypothetical protein